MAVPPIDSAIAFPLPTTAKGDASTPCSRLEEDVIYLFDELGGPLFRYVLSFGLSAHDGEDIIQETFLSLFQHLQLERSRQNLRGWLFRVAHNLSLKRRHANQKYDVRSAEEPFAEAHVDPTPNAEEQLVIKERQMRLLAVVQALPELDQRCLQLRVEGLRYREIAAVLDMSLGAVSISLTRALARLQRADER